MDITPSIPKGQNTIKGYGDMTFTVGDDVYNKNIYITPTKVKEFEGSYIDDITIDLLENLVTEDVEVLLIGCGETHMPIPQDLHAHFQNKNIGIEVMTTGAACRTYNVLLSEGRSVAAVLLRV